MTQHSGAVKEGPKTVKTGHGDELTYENILKRGTFAIQF